MPGQLKKRDFLIRVGIVDFIPPRKDRKTQCAPGAIISPKGTSLPLEQAVGKEFFRGFLSPHNRMPKLFIDIIHKLAADQKLVASVHHPPNLHLKFHD